MNRLIKFRVWNNKTKSWGSLPFFDDHFLRNSDNKLSVGVSVGRHQDLDEFTGLQDINGKDIYENDIVKYYGNTYSLMSYPEEECLVYWSDTNVSLGWMIKHKAESFKWSLTREFAKESLEVVGNIHENAELLKQ